MLRHSALRTVHHGTCLVHVMYVIYETRVILFRLLVPLLREGGRGAMMHNHTRFSVRSVKSVFILLPFGVVLYSVVLFLFYTKLLQNMKSPRHVLA